MTFVEKATRAWGASLPDWVRELALECDTSSLRQTAALLGASPAIVSLAINAKREDLNFIKGLVESKLMVTIVACPVLGVIPRNECLQKQAAKFSAANPLAVELYRACRNGCPHFKEKRK